MERKGKKYGEINIQQVLPTPERLASAILTSNTINCLVDVEYVGIPAQSTIFTESLQGFPTNSSQFIVLSNGLASEVPGTAVNFLSFLTGGPSLSPGAPQSSPDNLQSNDVVTFSLVFKVPNNPGNLSFDWKFGTDENPTFTQSFPDYFRADVFTSSGVFNIALLPNNEPVTVTNAAPYSNNVTGSSENPQPPFPVPNDVGYNAVTQIYTASLNLAPYAGEEITLAFRVADVNDSSIDSAVFIDYLRIDGCKVRRRSRGIKFCK